jgi:glycosyltransferase involved in cell wall biosynthesis
MKFSVLLPTRNRLELLKYAIETVRRQDYDDWEIIVSDNFSEEDIVSYVLSLQEPRIKYFRTASFLPVTDNWNNALEKCSGDYVIMLGDDDCLMKGYFRLMAAAIREFNEPDFIYTKAFMYAYPGVIPDHPNGYLRLGGCASFFGSKDKPFLLGAKEALDLVRQSMNFRLSFDFNMQFSAISRKFICSLEYAGKFFQSPYPDYYAHNVMFLKADRILIYPLPIVTVGISPKSFGFYYHNRLEKQGTEFLNNVPDPAIAKKIEGIVLSGNDINTCWLYSMETILTNFGKEFDFSVKYLRYRFLQVLHVFKGYYCDKTFSREGLKSLCDNMRIWEKLLYGASIKPCFMSLFIMPWAMKRHIANCLQGFLGRQYPSIDTKVSANSFTNILEVFERVEPTNKMYWS